MHANRDQGSSPYLDIEIIDSDAEPPAVESDGTDVGVAGSAESDLSDRDLAIAAALAEGLTYAQAGAVVGVKAKTVQRRMRDSRFAALVASQRKERFEQIAGQLSTLAAKAMTVLSETMDGDGGSDRWRAASAALNHAARYHGQISNFDLDRRLDEIEAALASRNQNQDGGEA